MEISLGYGGLDHEKLYAITATAVSRIFGDKFDCNTSEPFSAGAHDNRSRRVRGTAMDRKHVPEGCELLERSTRTPR